MPQQIENIPEIKEALKVSIPGIPFDPSIIDQILSGDFDADDIAREAAVRLADVAVPGLGVALGAAMPYIEKYGKAIIDVATGQKAKRDRRRRNWRGIRGVFELTMDRQPLLIYSAGKEVPSKSFLKIFGKALLKPASWTDSGYYKPGVSKVPYWVTDKKILKKDYSGSGISGKRTGVTYLMRAQQPAEIIKMLDGYYKKPGKKEARDKALKAAALLVRTKAEQLQQQADKGATAMKKKKPVVSTEQNKRSMKKASRQKPAGRFRAARSFTRADGPYLDSVVQIPLGENQWLNITSRVDTRDIAKRIAGAPTIAGSICGEAENVGEAVKKVSKATAANKAIRAAQKILKMPAVVKLVPKARKVAKQLSVARKLAAIDMQARAGSPPAVRMKLNALRASARPGSEVLRSALQLADRAYIVHLKR